MADSSRLAHIWTAPPQYELRRLKTMVEDEMMVKVGAKKESIEFHPLILAQKAERANTSFDLHYQRVKPPHKERLPASRNPWGITDNALRQMSNLSRQGPRKLQLPSLPAKAVKRVHMPSEDEEFQRLRYIRLLKREEILTEWSALQTQAFTARKVSHLSLPDIEPLRRYSTASLFSLKAHPVVTNKSAAAAAEAVPRQNKKKAVVHFTSVPPTGKPKSRWRGMARQLLWNTKAAQMRLPEELPRSEIRIYVSCTQDLSEEREFLDEVAYPELTRFCEKQGLSCHVVDLRHGSNRLKNDRDTFDVIQREISKCQKLSIGPCFVSLVGEEADDQELPGWLSHQDMLHVRGLLVKTHKVEAVEVLDNLYRLDSNYQPPIYLLEDSCFFAETQETAVLQEALPEVLSQLRQEGKLPEEPDFFSWSSLVKEIEAGLLSCVEPKRQTLCLLSRAGSSEEPDIRADNKRKLSVLSDVKVPEEYTARTGNAGADKLRGAIVDRYNRMGSKDNLILFNASPKKTVAYLREMCTLFLSAVTHLIERQIAHHEFDIAHHMTGAADVVQHVAIARQACSNYVGGETVLSRVSELLSSNPAVIKPIVVAGPEGSGKTALTSLIASALPRVDPLRKIMFRIVGLTLSSSTLFHLLTSLYCQVAFIYEMDPSLPEDLTLHGALQAFRDMLHEIRDKLMQKGPLTIILDGVEKIPGISSKHLSFLIASVPQGVTLVLSMLDSGPLFDTVKSVVGVEVVTCPVFTSERTATYVKTYLTKRDRVITNDQHRTIVRELSEDTVALVAKVSAAMASRWPSHTLNDDLDFSRDMESAFHRLVESCELQLGYRFTRYVLSLLVASRFGLGEFEILHIIATDTSLIDDIKEEVDDDLSVLEGYPYQLQLSRLLTRLDPFLYEAKSEGETILKISHEMLRYVVEVRFMADSFKHHIHTKLATFFQFTRRGHLLSSRDIVEGKHKELTRYLWRTLRSVPYHLCHCHSEPEKAWKRLKSEVFMKFSWVINEIYAGYFNDFVDDINYALETLGLESDILYFRQFLNGVREAVIFNPVSLASLMAGQDMKEMQEIQKSVQEAEEWLKQVHLQVLVPSSYTTPKTSQLQLKETLAKRVKSIAAISTEDRMILQYDTSISSLEHRTGEETALVSVGQPIISLHLWGEGMLTVVTTSPTEIFSLDTYAIEKGRHIKTTKLQDKPVPWLYVKPDGTAFYATGSSVKKVLLEKGQVSELFTAEELIEDACMSNQRVFKVVVLHTSPDAHLTIFDSRHPGNSQTISLLGAKVSDRCKPLDITKDSEFVVVACDRRLLVVNLNSERLAHSLDFNNVPVSMTTFSRSHEHVFVITPTGMVRCFKLDTGLQVMDATIRNQQKPQQLAVPASSSGGGRNSTSPRRGQPPVKLPPKNDKQIQEEELISTLVTSEDDHFLLAGTSQGRIYILHVPTGQPVCVISSGQAGVKEMVYFTNMAWFQSLATVDVTGWVKLWSLTPLFLRARTIIKDIITDEDLLNEEEAKMDLALYCQHFQERRNDRMFLNGPDVSSFYRPQVPQDLFLSVHGLDPALQTPLSWRASSRLGDCSQVSALSTGSVLSEVLVTVTREGEVARWSLQDGSLQSLQPCPCPLGKEEEEEEEDEQEEEKAKRGRDSWVESVRMVYYDQAIFVVVRNSDNNRTTVAVQYSEEKKSHSLVLSEVIASYVSTNSSLIVHVICGEHRELILVFWDLVKGQEEERVVLTRDKVLSKRASTLVFSNDLTSCALLVPNGKDDYTLNIWTLKSTSTGDAELADSEDKDEDVLSQLSEEPLPDGDDQASRKSSSTKETREFHLRQLPLQIKPTAIGFGLNDVILLGTSWGVTLIVALEKLSLTSAMTSEGVEAAADQPLSVVGGWTRLSPAHCGDVRGVRHAPESYVVTTMCSKVFCLWNLLQKKLVVRVPLDGGDEFTHHILSRDCRVLTFATSGGVLAVWGVQERKQLCAFKSTVAVSSLAMTPDNRRVAVLLDDEVTSRVQVFDVRNIDDIRVESGSPSEDRRDSMSSRNASVDDDLSD